MPFDWTSFQTVLFLWNMLYVLKYTMSYYTLQFEVSNISSHKSIITNLKWIYFILNQNKSYRISLWIILSYKLLVCLYCVLFIEIYFKY